MSYFYDQFPILSKMIKEREIKSEVELQDILFFDKYEKVINAIYKDIFNQNDRSLFDLLANIRLYNQKGAHLDYSDARKTKEWRCVWPVFHSIQSIPECEKGRFKEQDPRKDMLLLTISFFRMLNSFRNDILELVDGLAVQNQSRLNPKKFSTVFVDAAKRLNKGETDSQSDLRISLCEVSPWCKLVPWALYAGDRVKARERMRKLLYTDHNQVRLPEYTGLYAVFEKPEQYSWFIGN